MTDSQPGPDDAKRERTPDEIEAELEATRHDLAETVDALTAKLDVKTRAQDKASSVKAQAEHQLHAAGEKAGQVVDRGRDAVTDDEGSVKPAVPAAAAAVVAAAVAGLVVVLVRRRRRQRVLPRSLR